MSHTKKPQQTQKTQPQVPQEQSLLGDLESQKRKELYAKIKNLKETQEKMRLKYLLAQSKIYESDSKTSNKQFSMVIHKDHIYHQQVVAFDVQMGGYLFTLRVLNKSHPYNLNDYQINSGSFGSIRQHKHFQETMVLKKIDHCFYQVRTAEQKLIKFKEAEQTRLKEEAKLIERQKISLQIVHLERKKRQQQMQILQAKAHRLKTEFHKKLSQGIKEYCILKFCSALKIGPYVPIQTFDILLFDDCLCFAMQSCQPNIIHPDLPNKLTENLTESLQLMHYFQIVHSDIKPANIFYSIKYQKYVFGDYGLSTFLDYEVGKKQKIFTYFGTLGYTCKEMDIIKNEKKPNWVDLYDNDWYGLQQSINYVQEQLKKLTKQMNKSQLNVMKLKNSQSVPLSWKDLINRMKIFGDERQIKLLELKYKILIWDFDFLKFNTQLIGYFRREMLLFIKNMKLNFHQQQFFYFALFFSEVKDKDQQLQIQEDVDCRPFDYFGQSKLKKLNIDIQLKGQLFNKISAFLGYFIKFENLLVEIFPIFRKIIPNLIQSLKEEKLDGISELMEEQIEQDKAIKIIKQKHVKQSIQICFHLIFDFLKQNTHEQSKQKRTKIIHLIMLGVFYRPQQMIFLVPVDRFRTECQLNFFTKLKLIWIDRSFIKLTYTRKNMKQFGRFHSFFQETSLNDEEKLILDQVQQIFNLFEIIKQKRYLIHMYNVKSQLSASIIQILQRIKEFQLKINMFFSQNYIIFKLYTVVQNLYNFSSFLPNINAFLKKILEQIFNDKIVTKNQICNQYNSEKTQFYQKIQDNSNIWIKEILMLKKGYELFPQYFLQNIVKNFQLWQWFINQLNLVLLSQQEIQLLEFAAIFFTKQLQNGMKFQDFFISICVKLEYAEKSNQTLKQKAFWKPVKQLIETFKNTISGQQLHAIYLIHYYIFCYSQQKLPEHLERAKEIFVVNIKDDNIAYYSYLGLSILNEQGKLEQIHQMWSQQQKFFGPLMKKISRKYSMTFQLRQFWMLQGLIANDQPQKFLQFVVDILVLWLQICKRNDKFKQIKLLIQYIRIVLFKYQDNKIFFLRLLLMLNQQFYHQNFQIAVYLFITHLNLLQMLNVQPDLNFHQKNILVKMCKISYFSFIRNSFQQQLLCYFLSLGTYKSMKKQTNHLKKVIFIFRKKGHFNEQIFNKYFNKKQQQKKTRDYRAKIVKKYQKQVDNLLLKRQQKDKK